MPQTKRVFSTFRLLYLPFHLFVLFFIGIVEKEVFGENGASWNGRFRPRGQSPVLLRMQGFQRRIRYESRLC